MDYYYIVNNATLQHIKFIGLELGYLQTAANWAEIYDGILEANTMFRGVKRVHLSVVKIRCSKTGEVLYTLYNNLSDTRDKIVSVKSLNPCYILGDNKQF